MKRKAAVVIMLLVNMLILCEKTFAGDELKLLASTYAGGLFNDYITGVAVDKDGNVFIAGHTGSENLPVTETSYGRKYNGGVYDVFVAKLTNDLSKILAITYLGGSGTDKSSALFVDGDGNVYVAGTTNSRNFPVATGAYSKTFAGGATDGFIAKFDNGLSKLIASTYIGSEGDDTIVKIAPGHDGNVYAAGYVNASAFHTTKGAYQKETRGHYDVFVIKVNGDLTEIIASTLVGGSAADYAADIIVDKKGFVYVAGNTESRDFPVSKESYGNVFNGGVDAFLIKLNPDLSEIAAATFLGGRDNDFATAIALDKNGDIYIAGHTGSPSFPATEDAFSKTLNGATDVFISHLNNDLSNIIEATLLGGRGAENTTAIALGRDNEVFIVGYTNSDDFPVSKDAWSAKFAGVYDMFVSKFSADLSKLSASTYFGADSYDYAMAAATDDNGNLFVAGHTISKKLFTTERAVSKTFNGGTSDGVVMKFYSAPMPMK